MDTDCGEQTLSHHFRHSGPAGFAFKEAGSPSWPYPQFEVLSFRSRHDVQAARDIVSLLSVKPSLRSLLERANLGPEDGFLHTATVEWTRNRNASLSFWNLVTPELPLQLSEDVTGFNNVNTELRPYSRKIDEQLLTRHPFYESAQILRNEVLMLPRGDGKTRFVAVSLEPLLFTNTAGHLLTFAPPLGVMLQDSRFQKGLESHAYDTMDGTSVFRYVYDQFCTSGTDTWPEKTLLWFTSFLITELLSSPDTIHGGNVATAFHSAYYYVVQDLVSRG